MTSDVAWYTRYDSRGASSRYRAYQYLNALGSLGWESRVEPLGPPVSYGHSASSQLVPLARRFGRLVSGPRADEIHVVQKSLWPPTRPWPHRLVERFFSSGSIVWDVDDALYAAAAPQEREMFKIATSRAAIIVAGNSVIADRAANEGAARIEVIPTCVDDSIGGLSALGDYKDLLGVDLLLGWIGSPATEAQLAVVAAPLRDLLVANPSLGFVALGGSLPTSLRGQRRAMARPWSPPAETALLSSMDIGIAPLFSGEIEDGKCGHKLLKYMAAGVAACATSNQVHRKLANDGAFLVERPDHWFASLMLLLKDGEERERLAARGRKRVSHNYTIEHGVAAWDRVLSAV